MSLELQTHKSIFGSTSSLRCHQNKIKRHIKHKMFYTELLMFSYKLVHFSVLLIFIKGSSSPPDSGSQPQKSCRWMPLFLTSHNWPNKVKSSQVKSLSHVRLFATPWTIAYQAPLSMGFSRREYWSGLPFPSPGDLPDPGTKPESPALQILYHLGHIANPIASPVK